MCRFLAVVSLFSTFATAQSVPWRLDVEESQLVVKVWKSGVAAGLAHDHIVRASKFSGTVNLNQSADAESLSLELEIEVKHLIPDEPEVRKAHQVAGKSQ